MSESIEASLTALAEASASDSATRRLSDALSKGDVTIPQLVEIFDCHLKSVDVQQRDHMTQSFVDVSIPDSTYGYFLTQILETVMSSASVDDRTILADCFKAMLVDWSCLSGGLKGSLALLRMCEGDVMEETAIRSVVDVFLECIDIQSLKLSQRLIALELLLEIIQKMGDVMDRVIVSISGEKDPRCLITVFKIVRSFVDLLGDCVTLRTSAEDLFDVIACYFPITETDDFKVGDAVVVKADDLVKDLNLTLSCTPAFAEYCLPLILEKLSSDLKDAKLSALSCLSQCTKQFKVTSFYAYFSRLWIEVKKLLFCENNDETITEAAVSAVQHLCRLQPSHEEADGEGLSDLIFLEETVLDVIPTIRNTQQGDGQCQPIIQLLSAVWWLNDCTASNAISSVLRPLLDDFVGASQQTKTEASGPIHPVTDESDGDYTEMDLDDVEDTCGRYLTVLRPCVHALSEAVRQDAVGVRLQSTNMMLTAFLMELYHAVHHVVLHKIQMSVACSIGFVDDVLLMGMDLLYLDTFFNFIDADRWMDDFGLMLPTICARREHTEHSQTLLLTTFAAIIDVPPSNTERDVHWHSKAADAAIQTLLPRDIPIDTDIAVSISVQSLESRDIRFRMLDVIGQSTERQQMLMGHLAECCCHWLMESWTHPSKQTYFSLILQFVREKLTEQMEINNQYDGAERLLDALVEFLQGHALTDHNPGSQTHLLQELVYTLCCLVHIRDSTSQKATFQIFQRDIIDHQLWQLVIFCGMDDAQDSLLDLNTVLSFPRRCIDSIALTNNEAVKEVGSIAYEVSSAALFRHIRCSIQQAPLQKQSKATFCNNIVRQLGSVSNDPFGFIRFASQCLAAVLCFCESYPICEATTKMLLPSMMQYIRGGDDILDNTADRSLEASTRDAITALVSDKNANILLKGASIWMHPIRRQRAFTVCLDALLPNLEHTQDRHRFLIALGCLIRHTELKAKRVLPWMLVLMTVLQSRAVDVLDSDLLTSMLKLLSVIVRDSNSKGSIRTKKHDIMRTLLTMASFDGSHEIRSLSIHMLTFITVSVMTKDERLNYLPMVERVITESLDDRKRKVRQLAVRCRLKLETFKETG